MRVNIIAIGQKMPAWAQTAFEDYAKRMPPEWHFSCKALKAEPRGGASTAKIMQAEAERIQQEIEERKKQLKNAAMGEESENAITNEVREFARNNPEITANLLRNWMKEGE